MYEKKHILSLDDFDKDLLTNGMNEFRNLLLDDGLPTEDVDKLLVRIINAPLKRDMKSLRADAR